MSPLQIEILLWYHARACDFRDGEMTATAVRDAIDNFLKGDNLLEPIGSARNAGDHRTYRLTARGEFYVEALMTLPLPICRWEIPQRTAA